MNKKARPDFRLLGVDEDVEFDVGSLYDLKSNYSGTFMEILLKITTY